MLSLYLLFPSLGITALKDGENINAGLFEG